MVRTLRVAAFVLLATAAQAGAGGARAADLGAGDRAFLVKEARGAAYELQSAKLATGKAARPDVKAYAEKLVHDHERYNAALAALGTRRGLTLPTEPDDAGRAHLEDLGELSGAAFDALYIKEALRINAEDERDGDKEKVDTEDQAIKDFLAEFDDMDKSHEKLARDLEKASR